VAGSNAYACCAFRREISGPQVRLMESQVDVMRPKMQECKAALDEWARTVDHQMSRSVDAIGDSLGADDGSSRDDVEVIVQSITTQSASRVEDLGEVPKASAPSWCGSRGEVRDSDLHPLSPVSL
jgi:hypothetical protein